MNPLAELWPQRKWVQFSGRLRLC